MIIVDTIEQGTDEWFEKRLGIPTASHFSEIITSDGKPSKQKSRYLFQCAAEKVLGTREESYTNPAMERGKQLEEEARNVFSMITENEVIIPGFCYYDERKDRGGSPDGLIGDDAGIEIKCPLRHTHISYVLSGKLPSEYFHQVHGYMYLTNRKHWYFFSYYPGLAPLCLKVVRDDKFIDALDKAIDIFVKDVDEVCDKIRP